MCMNNNFLSDMIKCYAPYFVTLSYFKLTLHFSFLRVNINEFAVHSICNDLILIRNAQEEFIRFFRWKAVF